MTYEREIIKNALQAQVDKNKATMTSLKIDIEIDGQIITKEENEIAKAREKLASLHLNLGNRNMRIEKRKQQYEDLIKLNRVLDKLIKEHS